MTAPLGGQSAATVGDGQSATPGDQGTGTATDASGQSAATGTTATPPAAEQSVVSRAEFDQLRAQLTAADKRATQAEQERNQLRDKDMPALQKLERDLAEAVKVTEAVQTANQTLRVENAFLTANEYDWHDPKVALNQLDRSKITVDDQGNVAGMKDALKALATAHPYLLKPKPAEGEGGAGGTGAGNAPPGTAPANGGIGQQTGSKPDIKALAKDFPALRQRIGG